MLGNMTKARGNIARAACYVREYQSPAAVLGAVYRASYPIAGVDFPACLGFRLRGGACGALGFYGDPAAVPADIGRG